MRWILLMVVLLAGCGPSALDKAKAQYEIRQAEYEALEEKVKGYNETMKLLSPEGQQEIRTTIMELRDLMKNEKAAIDELKAEVMRLSR